MRKGTALFVIAAFIGLVSFRKGLAPLFIVPKGWPAPAYDFKKNPLSEQKIDLGRRLFYDPILSKDSTISCNSCHSQYMAFAHTDHDLSHGIYGKIGTRNAPGLMNLAWKRTFMWDGAINHLDAQALAPMSNPVEMDENIANVVTKLQHTPTYPTLFRKAFGDSIVTGEHVLKAISQFMLTLVSANSKYDKVKRGEDTFNTHELNGYHFYQQKCAACHAEPLFTNDAFENNGLGLDTGLKDIGKMKVSHEDADSLKFKVPTLRNIEYTAPYMHDGRFKNLNQVLNNYIMGIQHTPGLNPLLQKGIYMDNNQKANLVAFLRCLSDKDFLTNPKFSFLKK